jgi:integrase
VKLKLDAKNVTSLALAKGQDDEFAWDADLEGFGLRLRRRRDGGLLRTWAAQYRANGRTRRVTLGSFEKLTPAQAREGARRILARVALGHDPQAEKQAKRVSSARTFRVAVEAYLAAKQHLRPVSFRLTKLYLCGPYFQPLHSIGVADVTHADVAARLSAITRAHSAHTAAAARRALSTFYRWCMEEGWTQANPVIGTRKPAQAPARDRVLSDAELVAVWHACSDDDYGRVIRLLTLLGSRRQEVGGLRWSELDLDAGTWTLPKERSKNRRAHTIALPPAALDIIRAIPQRDRDPLFGTRANGFTSWIGGKQKLDQRLGDSVKAWRVHDTRRSVATGMANLGIEPHHIEATLNHFSGHRAGVAGTYNRATYDRAVQAALLRWSEHLIALVEGRTTGDRVVPLRA